VAKERVCPLSIGKHFVFAQTIFGSDMKEALLPNGTAVAASATAPTEATCPHCGGVLLLRQRRTMSQSVVAFYWRHASNQNLKCRARRRPTG
jgi:hypothetical protein